MRLFFDYVIAGSTLSVVPRVLVCFGDLGPAKPNRKMLTLWINDAWAY